MRKSNPLKLDHPISLIALRYPSPSKAVRSDYCSIGEDTYPDSDDNFEDILTDSGSECSDDDFGYGYGNDNNFIVSDDDRWVRLAILHQPDDFFSNHQFLTAIRINQFAVSHQILRFQNLQYSSVDLDTTFRQRYKQGQKKLKHRKKYKPHTKAHTELQLLYGEEGNKFVTSAIDNGDLLLIYGFYIPCQDNSHSVNDCASNMADFFASHRTLSGSSPAVIVAYDEAYPSTDTVKSEAVLTAGNTTLLSLGSDSYTLECICCRDQLLPLHQF